jgi:hypothetical protein
MRKSERKIGPYMENSYRAEYRWQVEDADACQELHILPNVHCNFSVDEGIEKSRRKVA